MLQSEQILVTVGEVARKGAVVLSDDFARPDQTGLGSTPAGVAWKNQAAAFFSIASGAAVKQTGTATTRYFAMLPCSTTGDLILSAQVTTNPTTNLTDTGLMVRSLDSTATRGGQLYVSIRKTSTANSVRVLHRTDTSGSDTVLVQNTAAGWADGTTYNVQVVLSGDSIDVLRDGASIIGGPFILTSGVRATLGTDVGISFTNTDTGSRIESMQVWDPNYVETPPATPTATTVRVIAHRGTLSSSPASTENSIAGLDILAGLRRPVSGIEWDVRVSSDGVLFLMHDESGARTHPAMGSTGVEGYTASQLDGFGVTRLTDGLAACAGRGFERINLQHYFPGSNTSALNLLLANIAASPVASRVKIMTSISGPYAPAQIRAAGWTGPIGTYGSTAANYAGSGDGKAQDFADYNISVGYMPPGAYMTNRAHAQALVAAGRGGSGSTENSSSTWAAMHADNAAEALTDDSQGWLALYEPPEPYRAGTSSGSWAFTGSATGSVDRNGAASGSWAFGGAASGQSDRNGVAAGSWSFTGTATGTAAPAGVATGSWGFTGAATGSTTPTGTATGSWAFSGAATGSVTTSGTATGAWAFTGTSSGSTTRTGTASGSFTYAATATGQSDRTGTAPGAWSFTGTAAGDTTKSGTAAGSFTYTGSATGSAPVVGGANGIATGVWGFTGSASGSTTKTGNAPELWSFTATATGSTTLSGTSSGTWAYLGSAVGSAPAIGAANGAALGTWAYTGTTVGSAPVIGAANGTALGVWSFTGQARGGDPAPTPPERLFPATIGQRRFPASISPRRYPAAIREVLV